MPRAPLTWSFLALCWIVTLPGLVWPAYREFFSGLSPREYPFQLFTAVLQHGWPGFPALVHLGLNSLLIVALGPPCERLLGTWRMLVMCGLAALANAGVQLVGEGVNGSSLVIWAWGPPVYLALHLRCHAGGEVRAGAPGAEVLPVLVVMYLVITIVMPALPYLAGWRGNPLMALVLANQYHLAATLSGIACAWWWREEIHAAVIARDDD